MSALLIWWTNQQDCDLVRAIAGTPVVVSGDVAGDGPAFWPQYISDEFEGRIGRAGRGRLWVADRFGQVAIEPWPPGELAGRIGHDKSAYGGIVIAAEDLRFVQHMPGIVTDFEVRIVRSAQTVAEPVTPLLDAWTRVSDELDNIEAGMHAGLEDAASDMWTTVDRLVGPPRPPGVVRISRGYVMGTQQYRECASSPDGKHQVDTSMESGPNNCFYCEAPMNQGAVK